MDALTLDHVMELVRNHGGTRVSLYMPTRLFGPGSQEEDATRLRNHLRSAEEQLVAAGLRPAEIDALLAGLRALPDDRPFWLRSGLGLALFAGPEGLHTFQLPEPVADLVWVGSRYHAKPLLAFLGSSRRFWLLALSQKRVRLMEGTRYSLQEVPAEGIPTSLADAMRWEDYEKSSLQYHTGTSGQGGRRPAVFHGTGESDVKDEIVRYFRGIDRGLHELLKDSDAPLVLAGVDYLLPLYREVNSYPHLAEATVTGNPDGLGETALHERAWAVANQLFEAERARAAQRIEDLWASARTTPDPESIVSAATHARVALLLVAEDAQWWGSYDGASGRVSVHEHPVNGDEDLLDLSTLHTLLNGGEVVAMPASEMPHGRDAVALLRY